MQILPKDYFKKPSTVRNAGYAFLQSSDLSNGEYRIGSVIESIDGTLELCPTTFPTCGKPIILKLKRSWPSHIAEVIAVIDLEDQNLFQMISILAKR